MDAPSAMLCASWHGRGSENAGKRFPSCRQNQKKLPPPVVRRATVHFVARRQSTMRLAFLSAGLGALGLICLLVGLVGTTQRTVMIQDTGASWEQPPAFIRSKPAPGQPRTVVGAAFKVDPDSPAPPRKIVHNVIPEQILKAFSATNRPQTRGLAAKQTAEFGLKPIKRAQGQKLHMDFNGETPIGDDDFDAAGYNMEGVWDWKLGKFRSPKFVHLPEIEAYESPDGEKLEVRLLVLHALYALCGTMFMCMCVCARVCYVM